MKNLTRVLTALAIAGTFAPLAASAADVGTSIYQPDPIIVQAPTHHKVADVHGRAAYKLQIKAIRQNGQA